MTTTGFFSINRIGTTPANKLQVRARRREDLEELSAALERNGAMRPLTIIATPSADYQFRAEVHMKMLVGWLIDQIEAIDYSNFKHRIGQTDPKRAAVYGRVWGTLLGLEERGGDAVAFPDMALFDAAPLPAAKPKRKKHDKRTR